jgi:hypothetical protein
MKNINHVSSQVVLPAVYDATVSCRSFAMFCVFVKCRRKTVITKSVIDFQEDFWPVVIFALVFHQNNIIFQLLGCSTMILPICIFGANFDVIFVYV